MRALPSDYCTYGHVLRLLGKSKQGRKPGSPCEQTVTSRSQRACAARLLMRGAFEQERRRGVLALVKRKLEGDSGLKMTAAQLATARHVQVRVTLTCFALRYVLCDL